MMTAINAASCWCFITKHKVPERRFPAGGTWHSLVVVVIRLVLELNFKSLPATANAALSRAHRRSHFRACAPHSLSHEYARGNDRTDPVEPARKHAGVSVVNRSFSTNQTIKKHEQSMATK
eukprot:6193271-Pleurochrysis_carterae.AAC.1